MQDLCWAPAPRAKTCSGVNGQWVRRSTLWGGDRAARPPLRLDKDGIEHLKRFEDNRDAELEAMD